MSARAHRRAGPARRKRNVALSIESVGGGLLLAGGLALFGLVFLGETVFGAPPKLDPATLCPVDAPVALRVVLLVDRTDPYDPAQQDIIADAIARLQDGLPQYGRLTVHLIGAEPAAAVAPALDLCNPGSGEAANPWFANPRRVQARFDQHFAAPIDALVGDLMHAARADRSPLIESIAVLAATFNREVPTRVVLISDLLQHSDTLSLYRSRPSLAAFLASPVGQDLSDGRLAGVGFELVVLDNLRAAHRQGPALEQLWRNLLTGAGARVGDTAPRTKPAS